MNKSITICLVTANRPLELKKALLSIKKQTYQNFDVIVADDSQIPFSLKNIQKILPNAKYYHNKIPLREAKNTNKVFACAKTDYVCLFHDDDILEPNFIKRVVDSIDKFHPDLIYTSRLIIDQDDKIIATQISEKNHNNLFVSIESKKILDVLVINKYLSDYVVSIMTPGLVYRKVIFDKCGGFDSSVNTHIDIDLIYKILATSKKTIFINELLYRSRIWFGLSGRTKTSEKGNVFFAQKEIIDNFILFCKKNKIKNYSKNELYKNYALRCLSINGPFTWINLRFNGPYLEKLYWLLNTGSEIIKTYPLTILYPSFYILLFSNIIIPTKLMQYFQNKFLVLFLNKK